MSTVHLPIDIEEKLQILSLSRHKPKIEIIKEALELLLKAEQEERDSYEIGKTLFGRHGSGGIGGGYKERVKDKIRAKHNYLGGLGEAHRICRQRRTELICFMVRL